MMLLHVLEVGAAIGIEWRVNDIPTKTQEQTKDRGTG